MDDILQDAERWVQDHCARVELLVRTRTSVLDGRWVTGRSRDSCMRTVGWYPVGSVSICTLDTIMKIIHQSGG